MKMLVEAGVPAAVVQCLTGSGSKVGNWLTEDGRIVSVNLTGSTHRYP